MRLLAVFVLFYAFPFASYAQIEVRWLAEKTRFAGLTAEEQILAMNYTGQVLLLDLDGSMVRTFDIPEGRPLDVSFEPNGDVIMAGLRESAAFESFLARFDSRGDKLWEVSYDDDLEGPEGFDRITHLSDGSLFVTGYYCPGLHGCSGSNNTHAVLVSPDGNVKWQWQGTETSSFPAIDDVKYVGETPDGGIIMLGIIPGSCPVVVSFDQNGQASGSCITSSGSIQTVQKHLSDNLTILLIDYQDQGWSSHILQLDPFGNLLPAIPSIDLGFYTRSMAPAEGGYLVISERTSMLYIDQQGAVIWEAFPELDTEYPVDLRGISRLSDGSYILTGSIDDGPPWTDDFIARITTPSTTSTEDKPSIANPVQIIAYPNPGRDIVRFNTNVPANGIVAMDVFDLMGRSIRSLGQAYRNAGLFTIEWDGNDDAGRPVPSGIYLVRLISGETVSSTSLVITR